jgi:hypothetical protein
MEALEPVSVKREETRLMADNNRNDVVIAIAATLWASRNSAGTGLGEQPLGEIAGEAWDLYHKLYRAVLDSPRRHPAGPLQIDKAGPEK